MRTRSASPSAMLVTVNQNVLGSRITLPHNPSRHAWYSTQHIGVHGASDGGAFSCHAEHLADAGALRRTSGHFATARSGLEEQWDRGDKVPTGDLRFAWKKYRTFFQRLPAV